MINENIEFGHTTIQMELWFFGLNISNKTILILHSSVGKRDRSKPYFAKEFSTNILVGRYKMVTVPDSTKLTLYLDRY